MKYLLSLLVAIMPLLSFAQSSVRNEKLMAKFVADYNSVNSDGIVHMWNDSETVEWASKAWSAASITNMHKQYGKILSYEYLGIDEEDPNPGLAVYVINMSVAGTKNLSFTFDNGKDLGTFRFITSSDGIDKMMKNHNK